MEVVWAGGHRTTAQITRPVACLTQLSYYPQLAARARELADGGLHHRADRRAAQRRGLPPAQAQPGLHRRTRSATCCGPWASSAPASRPAATARPWPSTSGGCATWPRTWACPRSPSTPGSAAAGPPATCTPRPRLRVVRADPAEVERLRALHQVPRGQHNRRPWLKNQAASINTERGRNQRQCRRAAAMTALRLARLEVEAAQERLPQPVHVSGRGAGDASTTATPAWDRGRRAGGPPAGGSGCPR